MLEGKNLPDYNSLAKYIYYTTTGKSILSIEKKQNYFFAENNDYSFYLIYEPNIKFLRSNESALNENKLKIINKDKNKKKIVFATSKFMSQKQLSKNNITFCQLPYSLYTKIIK